MAKQAEQWGYHRIWYAEHHNMASIGSSATSVLIGHVASATSSIRLGSGGVMLPNHAPLTIAEQFGTLATLYGDRIDLGLGRAPGTDQKTVQALRRDPASADSFPQDVVELQGYLTGESRVPGVAAVPGAGTNVPLYILGSSMFGAKLAAALGLPYSFASHFAPDALQQAVQAYRDEFQPSAQLSAPYVMAGVNVIAADSADAAAEQFQDAKRKRLYQFVRPGTRLTTEQADAILAAPEGAQINSMAKHSAVGTPDEVVDYLDWFTDHAQADELIVVSSAPDREAWWRSLELLAKAAGTVS